MAKRTDLYLNSSNTVKGIQDDQFIRIENEFEQIRSSLGMYISKGNTDGALHLMKETFNNALDECNNPTPYWKNNDKIITVTFLESECKFIIEDTGRGIPADILVDIIQHKHVSTKTLGISEVRNKKICGINGTGTTVIAALTDYMAMTTYRGDVSKTVEVIDGNIIDHPLVSINKYRTGTVVELVPSEKYLGTIELTTELVDNFLRHQSYIIDNDITLVYKYEDKDKNNKIIIKTKQINPLGIAASCEYLSSSLEFNPINLKCIMDDFDISMAFSYDKSVDSPLVASYANFVITTEGGVHEVAAVRAICDYFSREAKKVEPNSKYEVTFDDCKKGLVVAVNLEHVAPKFEGQHKSKVSNKEVETIGRKSLSQAIDNYLGKNPNLAKKIITYLRQISRARQESNKIKGVSVKKTTTFLDDAKIKDYHPVAVRNSNTYKELYLSEGTSAMGNILKARNATYQAIYAVAGVTDNVHDLSLTQLLQKQTFMELIQILGAGIGKDFDINKLRYDKIIICTDSDADGSNITSLLLCFFLIFMPKVIEDGKLYKAMPPLYLMDIRDMKRKSYSGREWLYDKKEYYTMLNEVIANNVELHVDDTPFSIKPKKNKLPTAKPLSKSQTMKWLMVNSEYAIELDNLGQKSACGTDILEHVCYYHLKCQGKKMDFVHAITETYKEMRYDNSNDVLRGSHNGDHFSLICDNLFFSMADRYLDELSKNETLYVWYRNKKSPDDKLKRVTIGEFFSIMDKLFNIGITQRFKGVGEPEADLLFKTTTNPKFRKLLRYNMPDAENAYAVFELLHGKSNILRERRRDMIDSAKISYADIDN